MTQQGMTPRRSISKAMTVASLRSNTGGRFAAALVAAGIQVPKGISMSAMALIRDMAAAGGVMAAATTRCAARTGAVCQPAAAMGMIIKCGYARYVPDAKHYELTPAGRELLASAEAKGLMVLLADFEAQLREAEISAGKILRGGDSETGSLRGTLKREQPTMKGDKAA